jgi:pilus assembly protein Flp/PilA
MHDLIRGRERRIARTEEGASAVEYGLLVALIAAVIISVLLTLGPKLLPGMETVIANL